MIAKKKKVSIDFEIENYKLLAAEMERSSSSSSSVVNRMAWATLSLPEHIRSEIGNYCWNQYFSSVDQIIEAGTYPAEAARNDAAHWKALGEFFGIAPGTNTVPDTMREVLLKDGYCTFPKDWICLDKVFGTPAAECTSVYVVESRNSAKYGIPHFVIFSPLSPCAGFSPDITEEQKALIYERCAEAFPDFTRLFNLQVTLTGSENSDPEKLKQWDAAPCFDIFNMPDLNEPRFVDPFTKRFEPPSGAMIVRNPKPEQ